MKRMCEECAQVPELTDRHQSLCKRSTDQCHLIITKQNEKLVTAAGEHVTRSLRANEEVGEEEKAEELLSPHA